MGKIKHICKEKRIGKGFYDQSARLELQECYHLHYNDMRLVFTNPDVFEKLCDMFSDAKKKWEELGKPKELKDMALLSHVDLPDDGVGNRLAIEIQEDDRVHIHYNGLRIHITLEDLFTWFEVFEQASCNMPSEYIEEIDLDECTYHAVVDDRYMDILKEYDKFKRSSNSSVRGDIYNIHDFSYVEVKNKINNKQSSVGNYEQRNLGLPNEFDSAYDERKDGVYLIALYEMIKGWGYAQNGTPFENRYITANKTNDGKYYVHNAHRVAILKHLGYKKVKAYII